MTAVPTPSDFALFKQNKIASQTSLSLVNRQLADLDVATDPKSSVGWINDILKDNTGISFHRFHILAWTIVLGVLFVFSVSKRLSMTEFGATLLAFQGISAPTYIGSKIPEKQARNVTLLQINFYYYCNPKFQNHIESNNRIDH